VHAARKADQDDDNDDSSSDESILALIAAIRQNKRCNIGFSPSSGPVNPGIEAFTHLVQSSPLPSHKSNPSQGLPPLALTEINGQATLFTPREPLFPSSPSLPISMSISSAVHWSSPRFDNVSRRLFTAKEFSGSSPPEFRRSGIHLRENPDKMDVNKESSGPDNRANEIHVSTGMRIHFTGGVATVQLSQPEQSQISRAQDQVAQLAVVSSNQQWANIQTQPAQTPSVAAQVKQPIHAVDDQTVQAAQPAALPVQDPQSASENKDTDKEFDNNTTGEEPADVVEEDEEYNPAIDILLADIRNLQCSEAYKIPRAILTAAAQLAPLKDGTDKLDAEAQVLDFNPNLDDANHLIAAQNLLNKRSVHPDQLPLADLGPETFNDPNFFNSLPIGLPLPDLPAAQASQKAGLTLGDPSVLDQLEPIHVDLLSLLSPDNLDQPMIDLEEAVQGNKYPVIMDPAKGHGYVWLPRDKEGRSEPGWRKWPWDPLLPVSAAVFGWVVLRFHWCLVTSRMLHLQLGPFNQPFILHLVRRHMIPGSKLTSRSQS